MNGWCSALRLFDSLGGVTIADIYNASAGGGLGAVELQSKMGFHLKPRAVLLSSFDEVLLLDADSVLLQARGHEHLLFEILHPTLDYS